MSNLRETHQLAIYDESYVCALSLHNSLKRLGFTLHEVSANEQELLRFLLLKPVVLLFHLDSSQAKAYELLDKIRKQHQQLKILVQTVITDKSHFDALKKHGADLVVSGHCDFRKLIEKLVEMEDSFKAYASGIIGIDAIVNQHFEDPFLKIATDHKKLILTRLIASGKSTKIIAQVMDSPESDIEALRKKLLHDTHCQNVAEYISKAKDNGII